MESACSDTGALFYFHTFSDSKKKCPTDTLASTHEANQIHTITDILKNYYISILILSHLNSADD